MRALVTGAAGVIRSDLCYHYWMDHKAPTVSLRVTCGTPTPTQRRPQHALGFTPTVTLEAGFEAEYQWIIIEVVAV